MTDAFFKDGANPGMARGPGPTKYTRSLYRLKHFWICKCRRLPGSYMAGDCLENRGFAANHASVCLARTTHACGPGCEYSARQCASRVIVGIIFSRHCAMCCADGSETQGMPTGKGFRLMSEKTVSMKINSYSLEAHFFGIRPNSNSSSGVGH